MGKAMIESRKAMESNLEAQPVLSLSEVGRKGGMGNSQQQAGLGAGLGAWLTQMLVTNNLPFSFLRHLSLPSSSLPVPPPQATHQPLSLWTRA